MPPLRSIQSAPPRPTPPENPPSYIFPPDALRYKGPRSNLNPSFAHQLLAQPTGFDGSTKRISNLQQEKVAEFLQVVERAWIPEPGELTPDEEIWEWVTQLIYQKPTFVSVARSGVPKIPDLGMIVQRQPPVQRRVSWGDTSGLVEALTAVRAMRPAVELGGIGGPDDYGTVWMKFIEEMSQELQLDEELREFPVLRCVVWIRMDSVSCGPLSSIVAYSVLTCVGLILVEVFDSVEQAVITAAFAVQRGIMKRPSTRNGII